MTTKFASKRPPAILAKLAVGAVGIVIVVFLMMWLMGVFHPKVPVASHEPQIARPSSGLKRAAVRKILVPSTESAVGTIRAVHETSVASRLLAKVIEINAKAGQEVAEGDILVKLDDADLRARLQQTEAATASARAVRDQARIESDRVKQLFEQNAAAKIEADRTEAALRSAEADLQRAEQARTEAAAILEYATIRSPIAGMIIDKKVEAGDTVSPGQTLLTLYDPTRMQLVASVRESLTHRLSVGESIGVRVDALGKTCEGRISEIVPEAESASRTFAVKVTGPCPPGIYSGMFGRLLIPLGQREVLVVPRAAVRRVGQLNMVDVVEGQTLRRRAVQLGGGLGDNLGDNFEDDFDGAVEVLSGLKEGEEVVVGAP